MRRVDVAVRHVLGDVVGELKDPRIGFVTVTDVKTSSDLRHARVFISVFGQGADDREATLSGLRSAHGFLQQQVASQLALKRTPTLEFIYDDTAERAMRVDRLLEGREPE
jgi:ribosome-binding factor A